jgi:MYXO-CTERM domain-containing protein
MKRSPLLAGVVFLILLAAGGIVSADDVLTNITTTATAAVTTTAPDTAGGSIYFNTDPAGATIWLDNTEIGTSPFTHFTTKTGTFAILVRKKGYENYTGTVTVIEGKRVIFEAWLTRVSEKPVDTGTPVIPVATATTIRRSTIPIPTPWPTSAASSPVDPMLALGAAALCGFFAFRRR